MKNLTLFALAMTLFLSCQETPKTPPSVKTAADDSTEVAATIHGFYKWYKGFVEDTTKHINFVDNSGKHLKLDIKKMENHFAHFTKSGFAHQEFIENEYAFYKKCEKLWRNEPIDEVPSGLDADKYYCAQDWEGDYWTTAPVRIKNLGNDRVGATLYGNYFGTMTERNFELKKENGRWLLTQIECDMGVK